MPTPKFNPEKPYGKIIGDGPARYLQGGHRFDGKFNHIKEGKAKATKEVAYADMEYQQIKNLVTNAGYEYTNKPEGIALLEAIEAGNPPPKPEDDEPEVKIDQPADTDA